MQAASAPVTTRPPDRVAAAARLAGRELGRLDLLTARVRPWMVLTPLVVLGWAVMGLVAHLAVHNGWLYYEGGDGSWYYTTAWQLGHGRIPLSNISYGYPMALAPLARIAGANALSGIPYVVAFNALVLSPIALLCIYGITRMIAGQRYAYLVSGIWVVAPLLAIPYFLQDYHTRYVTGTLPAVVGLTALGDFPSMVCILVAVFFTFRAILGERDVDALVGGLAAGLAIAVKPANGVFLAAPLVALAIARNPRGLLVFAVGLAPSIVTLTLWKYRGLGYIPLFANHPQALAAGTDSAPVGANVNLGRYLPLSWARWSRNIDGFREFTWSRRMIEWAVIAGLIGLGRRTLAGAALIGVWLAAYLAVKGATVASFYGGSFFRYLSPAFPAAFLLAVSLPLLVPIAGRKLAAHGSVSGWPRSSRASRGVAGAGLVLSVMPLILLLAFSQQTTPTATAFPDGSQFTPANRFALRAVSHNGRVTLSWPKQSEGGTTVQYAIFRSQADQLSCTKPPGGALWCTHPVLATTVVRATHWTDRPGRGRWVYRVLVQAAGPPSPGNNLLLSRAATVLR